MPAQVKSRLPTSTASRAAFPAKEVRNRLRPLMQQIAEDSEVFSGEWDPTLDSLSVVSVIVSLEDLFDFKIAPEKVVKKGGYQSVDEGVEHIAGQLQTMWNAKKG